MKKLGLLVTLFCFGCATTHPGNFGQSLTPEGQVLKISADVASEYSDDSNIFLDFTLENVSSRWVKIDDVSIDFPNADGIIHNVIVGDDLKVWAESFDNKKKRDNQNANVTATALILGGLTVALLGATGKGNGAVEAAGLGAATAGYGVAVAHDLKQGQSKSIRSVSIPENYLLAPVTIPSGGFLRRWLLVNVPQHLVAKKALLTLKTIEGETFKYEVPIVLK